MTDVLVDASPQEAELLPAQLNRIDAQAENWLGANHQTESLVLLLARHGKIAYHKAFGKQASDNDAPLDKNSSFRVASISKVITATAAMQLVEKGELSLNRPLIEYIPEMRGKYAERVQVHQLMTHTSGFANVHVPPIFVQPPETDVPCPENLHPHTHKIRQALYGEDCFKKPGEQNMYCSENYSLLGEVIERVSGRTLDEQITESLFEPMGMMRSSMTWREGNEPLFCSREYSDALLDLEAMAGVMDGGGSMISTARELAAFGQMFLNRGQYNGRQILHPWTAMEMTRNQIPGVGAFNFAKQWLPEGSWGLGWMVQGDAKWPWSHGALQPRGTFYHQGGTGTALWVDPIHSLVGVYLSCAELDGVTGNPNWDFDRFQNMATAAVDYKFS